MSYKHGFDLPQTKLPTKAIQEIRNAKDKRDELRKQINDTLSNAALAKKWRVHRRTIEKVLSFETGRHVI
jgi:hypothetical protein